jgi:GNAT superfamily N-acetyltransferase
MGTCGGSLPGVAMTDIALIVRPAQSDDWPKLRAIRLEALSDAPEAFGSTYAVAAKLSNFQWRSMIERSLYFLAERDGDVVGMVSGGLNERHPGTHWLYGMYVTPTARGSQTAALLVDAVAAWARGEGALPARHVDRRACSGLLRASGLCRDGGQLRHGPRPPPHHDDHEEVPRR